MGGFDPAHGALAQETAREQREARSRNNFGAGGGTRTRTGKAQGILSPRRLPFRHARSIARLTAVGGAGQRDPVRIDIRHRNMGEARWVAMRRRCFRAEMVRSIRLPRL